MGRWTLPENHKLPANQSTAFEWPLEFLRGIAAFMVVLTHYRVDAGIDSEFVAFFRTGVDLFFVISGYVFGRHLLGSRIIIVDFFARRFFRIYPLYLAALLSYIAMRWWEAQGVEHIVKHLTLTQTWENIEIAHYYNPAFWSLPPEIEFYLFLPLFAALVAIKKGLPVLIGGAFLLHMLLAFFSPSEPHVFTMPLILSFHLPGLLIEFLLGTIAYYFSRLDPSVTLRLTLGIAGILVWILVGYVDTQLRIDGGRHAILSYDLTRGNMGFYAAIGFCLIVLACGNWKKPAPESLVNFSLFLGKISYGTYLFHNLVPRAARAIQEEWDGWMFVVSCTIVTVLIAWALHILIEAPMRRLGRRIGRTAARHPALPR